MTNPCENCPFLEECAFAFPIERLWAHARGEFPCHKTALLNEDDSTFDVGPKSVHCAGALIFLEKRNKFHQMMRIAERLGMYDRTKLNMEAPVR